MRNIPFLFLAALCLCLCACSGGDNAPATALTDPVGISVYFGDENCESILSEYVTLPEITPEYIMEALREHGVISESVAVNSFLMDKMGVIRLDLSENFGAMVGQMGTSGEYIMIGSLVNTFLDAYNAAGLILNVDGKPLETGHNIYDYTLEYYE